ncbi:MAG: hypothetical protein ASARMPREDX12_005148 [Alectoria sarmentosa]|nr:MAG: hypothetical protein ASARMPREDX12_005148 [Alectoria sarmentosa]
MAQSPAVPPPNQPALAPPPGVPAEFFSPFTLRPYQALTIVASVLTTTVMVAARLYTKNFIVKALKWEDYTCLVGWVQYQKRFGNYEDILYSVSLFFTKCSILLLIIRVFYSVKHDFGYWLSQALIVVNAVFYLAFFFVPIFQCSPRTKIWTPEEPGRCLDVDALYLASASFNVVSDIAMLSIPIYLIWNLQMSAQRKIGVSAIFATGAFFKAFSGREPPFHTHTKERGKEPGSSSNSMAEIACGLLCSCLVVLPRLYQHLASITPHNSDSDNFARAMADQNNPAPQSKRDWIQLHNRNDGSLPSPPSEAYKEWQRERGGTDA